MTFLAPGAWWLALLAFAPVLLLYLVRQRPRSRVVSTLLFWEALTPQLRAHPLWQRLRRWLSYLVQLACLLLLVAALARPARDGQSAGATSTVLVLDASASLQSTDVDGTRAWDRLLAEARSRLSTLRANDRVTILRAGASPEVVRPWTGNRRRALEALSALAPDDRPSDPTAALRLAREIASTAPSARIVLFSDRVWSSEPPAELLSNVELVDIPSAGPNAGIARFDARRSFAAPGAYAVTAEIVASPAAPWRGEALLHRDDRLVDAREIDLPAGGHWTHSWTETDRAAARYHLVLDHTAGQRLARDKSAELLVPALPRPVVRIVGERQPFLEAALASLPEVDFAFVEPAALVAEGPRPSLWIFSAVAPPADFVPREPVLLLSPAASGFWGKTATDAAKADATLVTDFTRDHPLFRHVDFEKVRPGFARVFEPPQDAEIFAASFGTPLLYGRWDERARWLVAPFDIAGGNLVFRTAFPILLANLLNDPAANDGISAAPLPGPTITRLSPLQLGTTTTTPATSPALTLPRSFRSYLPEPWRLVLFLGVLWTLIEWRLYARRITE